MQKSAIRKLCPFVILAVVCVSPSCGKGGGEGPIGFGIHALAPDVQSLKITVTPYVSTASECSPHSLPVTMDVPVGDLTDLDDNDSREAVISNLPYGCPLYVEVLAYVDGVVEYSGRADGVVIQAEGQRQFLDMTLTQEDQVSLLEATLETPAFGLTATPLAETDGRVLIAGGVTGAESTPCTAPYETGHACFMLTAGSNAYVFDQGSGTVVATRGQMKSERAFHSATRLADGRVLLAGGFDRAMLVVKDNSAAATWAGWEIVDIRPEVGTGFAGSLNSWEIFDPELNALPTDPDRNGDIARGGFYGTSGNHELMGTMSHARFAHAAILYEDDAIPTVDERRVFLVGGIGPAGLSDITTGSSNVTVDVFRLGYTPDATYDFMLPTFPNSNTRRALPAATLASDKIWVLGGTAFPGDEDNPNVAVGDAWSTTDEGQSWNNSPVSFSDFATEHPEWVRLMGGAAPLGAAGTTVLFSGWYGARCSDVSGTATPTFQYDDGLMPPTPIPTYVCPPPGAGFTATLDFSVDTGVATPVITAAAATSAPHALAAVLPLTVGGRAGAVLVMGGISDLDFTGTEAVDLYDGTLVAGAAQCDTVFATSHTLNAGRSWAAPVEVNGGNVMIAGGADFDLAAGTITILDSVEFLNWAG